MENFKNILQVIYYFVAMGGVAFAGIQLRQIKSNRKKQYDQARREKTAEMVTYYTQRVNPQTRYVEKIVANFDDDQCIDLYNCVPFVVNEETHNKLCSICPNKSTCTKETEPLCKNSDGKYYVKDELLYCLRGTIINYLNTLESVLLTWELGIVEQDVIVEQFAFLDKKRQKERALETFRSIAGGGHSYPAIEKFYQYLKRESEKKSEESLKDIIK